MTTIIAWKSVDASGVSALNIASDSRYSWIVDTPTVEKGILTTKREVVSKWDGGKKLFSCRNSPDFFGFSGRVVTQSTILSQIVDAIDFGVLNFTDLCPEERHLAIVEIFKSAHQRLDDSNKAEMSFFHGFREGCKKESIFHFWETSYSGGVKDWKDSKKETSGNESSIIAFSGTGGPNPGNELSTIQHRFGSNVSSIVQSFNAAIQRGKDRFSGGLIQIMKIDRTDPCPQPVGLSYEGSRFFLGLDLGVHGAAGSIDWRDENYTFLDGNTMEPRSGAKNQSFRSK